MHLHYKDKRNKLYTNRMTSISPNEAHWHDNIRLQNGCGSDLGRQLKWHVWLGGLRMHTLRLQQKLWTKHNLLPPKNLILILVCSLSPGWNQCCLKWWHNTSFHGLIILYKQPNIVSCDRVEKQRIKVQTNIPKERSMLYRRRKRISLFFSSCKPCIYIPKTRTDCPSKSSGSMETSSYPTVCSIPGTLSGTLGNAIPVATISFLKPTWNWHHISRIKRCAYGTLCPSGNR